MDELQISGKRFLSSRRVAKDNGYHTDYIGQLIRGGKIKGQKVGRAWYVDAASFDAYLGQESAPTEMLQPKIPEQRSSDLLVRQSSQDAGEARPFAQEFSAPAIKIEETKIEEVKKVEEIKVEPKVEIKKVSEPAAVAAAHYVPVASGGLRFVADDEPLLPEIENKVKISRMPEQEKEVSDIKDPVVQSAVVAYRPRGARVMIALAGLGVVIFIFSAVVSSAVFQKMNIEAGNPASVGYGIEW